MKNRVGQHLKNREIEVGPVQQGRKETRLPFSKHSEAIESGARGTRTLTPPQRQPVSSHTEFALFVVSLCIQPGSGMVLNISLDHYTLCKS